MKKIIKSNDYEQKKKGRKDSGDRDKPNDAVGYFFLCSFFFVVILNGYQTSSIPP